jgi:hypothetical protein
MGCGCNQNKQILPTVPIRGNPNTNKNNLDAVRLLRDSLPELTDTPASNLKVSNPTVSKPKVSNPRVSNPKVNYQTDVNRTEQIKPRRAVRRRQRVMRRRRSYY